MKHKHSRRAVIAGVVATFFLSTVAWAQGTMTYAVKALPASVVKTFPEAGATDVDPGLKEITVTFSKNMKDRSWSVCQSTPKENYPEPGEGKMHYQSDKRTCVMPVKLEPGRTYVLWFNRGQYQAFRDEEGMSSIPYLLVFETKKQ